MELCLKDQEVFKSQAGWEMLLSILPGDRGESSAPLYQLLLKSDIAGPLRAKWQKNPDQSSLDRWQDVMAVVGRLVKEDSPLQVSK